MSLAERFAARFAGLERAHGEYLVPPDSKPNEKGKIEGRRQTVHTPPTLALWTRHLTDPAYGLGIVPIRDDATCVWGVIDIDVYPLDLSALWRQVAEMGLPLVLCRTKSGGAHLFLFCCEAAPAKLIRDTLLDWALALGYPGVEVFPKQIKLASTKDYGNWLNMPYQSGERTTRYAVYEDRQLTPEEFLDHADRFSPTIAQIKDIKVSVTEGLFSDGPPCLQVLAKRGFPAGSRNNALFNIAIYTKKVDAETWLDELHRLNEVLMVPSPKTPREVDTIAKSVSKRNYNYKCKDIPINAVCNRQICVTREHGVGGGKADPGVVLGDLIKFETDPPTWIWSVDGARMELTTEELINQSRFHSRCVDEINKLPDVVNPTIWRGLLNEHMANVEIRQVPEVMTPEGQMWDHLKQFCVGQGTGRAIDELLLGRTFTDVSAQRTYFRAADFLDYLLKHGVQGTTGKKLYNMLLPRQLEAHQASIKGQPVDYFSIPAFERQSEHFTVPRQPPEEAM